MGGHLHSEDDILLFAVSVCLLLGFLPGVFPAFLGCLLPAVYLQFSVILCL
jgi:hypothetical protein